MMDLKEKQMSNWTLERTFSTYVEAKEFKEVLQQSSRGATIQVKIKRYSTLNGVERYGVKTRTDPSLADAVKQIEEKTEDELKVQKQIGIAKKKSSEEAIKELQPVTKVEGKQEPTPENTTKGVSSTMVTVTPRRMRST